MNLPPSPHLAACCDDSLDFYNFERAACDPRDVPLPNDSVMGVIELGPPDMHGDREFLSSRPLTQDELRTAWAEHHARHGLLLST